MKSVTLVRRSVLTAPPGETAIGHGMELEVTSANDTTKEIFVKQRITKPDLTFDDVFVAVASPAQLEDLPVNAPDSGSSYFRVAKIDLVHENEAFLSQIFQEVVLEVQLLMQNLDALSTLVQETTYTINGAGVAT